MCSNILNVSCGSLAAGCILFNLKSMLRTCNHSTARTIRKNIDQNQNALKTHHEANKERILESKGKGSKVEDCKTEWVAHILKTRHGLSMSKEEQKPDEV